MSKHTPGPWLIADNGTFVYALGNGGTNVFWADVQSAGSERAFLSEKRANARLIAAAPELLEALTDALKYYDAWLANTDVTPNESLQAWTSKARAAITKATEGQK